MEVYSRDFPQADTTGVLEGGFLEPPAPFNNTKNVI